MSRPYYCTEKNLVVERTCCALLEARLKKDVADVTSPPDCKVVHVGGKQHNPADGEVYEDGKLIALVEVKGREKASSTTYSTWHLSNRKFAAVKARAERENLELWILFKWSDGLFFLDVAELSPDDTFKKMGGRYDRNDPNDFELLIHFPAKKFKRV